jgi:hypothetical protein
MPKNITTAKINNPLFIGQIAPLIQGFYDRIYAKGKLKGISYESFYTHLVNTAQNGGNMSEVWIALKDGEALAFASWSVLGWPHFGTVYCSTLYSSAKDDKVPRALIEKFLEFAKNRRAPYIVFTVQNEATGRLFKRILSGMDIEIEPTGITQFSGRV